MSKVTESGSPALNLEKCSVVLLDVAGTTTSINFVKETLFPYVTKQAEEFLKAQWEEEIVKEAVKTLKDAELDLVAATAAVKELTEQNSDNKGLKTIQGLIYKKGYEGGDLKAHVFSDVASSLEAWAKSKKVIIYSTGSVESQQLLFSHTAEGDISSHISKYFDQSVGEKTNSESYEKIAKEMEVKTHEILFITDNSKEAEAAKTAGIVSVLVKREGNEDLPEEATKTFPVVSDLKEIVFENPAKRKNDAETVSTEEQPPSKLAKTDMTDDKAAAVDTPTEETPQPEEKMEVDSPVEEKEAEAKGEEKAEDKPSEPTNNDNDKTVPDSTEDKTEKTNSEQIEPEKVEETPMETVDSVTEPEKVTEDKVDKPEETEEKKEEPVSVTEEKMEVAKEKKTEVAEVDKEKPIVESKTEKMDAEDSSESSSNKESSKIEMEKKEGTVDTSAKEESKEISEIDSKENGVVETKKSAVSETNDEEIKEEKRVEDEKIIEKKVDEEKIIKKKVEEEKVVENKVEEEKVIEKKVEAEKEVKEKSKVDSAPETTEEKVTPSNEKEKEGTAKESKVIEESTKVEMEATSTDDKDGSAVSTSKCEKDVEEKAESSEACPKEDKSEASSSDDTKANKDEKENKSQLANGVENGDVGKTEVVNGDAAEEKQNGDAQKEESDNIKVKKIEEAPDSTPAVSVEV